MPRNIRTLELPKSPEVIALAAKLGPICEDEPMGVVMQTLLGMLLVGLYARLPAEACAAMSELPFQELIALIFDAELSDLPGRTLVDGNETVQ